ncbi:DoxX family protein [Actinocatenispora rupis]|uniref:Oxidoreductase n=1 Tax=Actinocatenispora rupis TaxID=519421 RepID=A0A8J3NC78_9ACTN|nr:DoxX family protein [Actinocatenispora rupis]GID11452.1 hypothetical protein Aru02nite_23410 [Actinocatenispora rupis]
MNTLAETGKSLCRMTVGLLFACHGTAGLFGFPIRTGHVPAVFAWPGWWAAAIEFATGLLVLVGLGTRVAALLASGTMAYAYFTVHQPHALWPIANGGEPAAVFCWTFLLVAVVGPGRFSLDGLLGRRRRRTVQVAGEYVGS